MKKLLPILFALALFESCKNADDIDPPLNKSSYYISIIDSCEYVNIIGRYGFCHKGNCKFCVQRKIKSDSLLAIKFSKK